MKSSARVEQERYLVALDRTSIALLFKIWLAFTAQHVSIGITGIILTSTNFFLLFISGIAHLLREIIASMLINVLLSPLAVLGLVFGDNVSKGAQSFSSGALSGLTESKENKPGMSRIIIEQALLFYASISTAVAGPIVQFALLSLDFVILRMGIAIPTRQLHSMRTLVVFRLLFRYLRLRSRVKEINEGALSGLGNLSILATLYALPIVIICLYALDSENFWNVEGLAGHGYDYAALRSRAFIAYSSP